MLCCALFIAHLGAQTITDKRLVFSTLQGGDRNDDAQSVAVDQAGFIYVTGETESRNLEATPVGGKPLTGAVFNGYLTKYAPGGKEIVWRQLIGGSSNTVPHAVILDRDSNIWVAGTTGARDLPLMKPVQDKQTGLNIAFLMKFDPQGKLLFSTYFGGNRNEEGLALASDAQGAVYLAGRASSTDLPVKNALQPAMAGGGQDGFVAKYTADYQLAWATYLGGTDGTDNIFAIAVGPDGGVYVTGETMSPGLPTPNAWMKTQGSYSSYLAKLSPAGDKIEYYTYIGFKGGYTRAQALAIDAQGRALVSGYTSSKQLPVTENALQKEFAGGFRDAFLLRLSADGSAADYLSYIGGRFNGQTDPDETAPALAIDTHGHVYVGGQTSSSDFLRSRALQDNAGGVEDAWLLRLDIDNSRVIFSTLFGGAKKDTLLGLALGPGENVTVVGEAYSVDLPLLNAVQSKLGSNNDAWIGQICDPWPGAWTPNPEMTWTQGTDPLQPVYVEVWSGCTQKFPATAEIVSDQPWVTLTADQSTLPMKLKLDLNTAELQPGEYTARVRVSVPDSYLQTVELPLKLTVAEPPPPPAVE